MKLKQFRISLESMVKCRKSPVCTCTVPSHSIDMFYRWQCINHDLYFYQHHSYHLYQSISYPYVIYVICQELANSSLEPHKKTLPRPQGLVGAAGKVHRGLSGAWELRGSVWGVLASFEGWQTAALNLHKRTLPRLRDLLELQERFTAA